MIRTQINLEEEQYRLLTLEAKRQNRSLSDLIRKAVNESFKQIATKGNADVLIRLSKLGGKSGDPYLAQNYKKYLYEKK